MNYPEALAYFYEKLPAFHRIGKAAYKTDLQNIIALCQALENPQNRFKSIHIAGTNGKGSTSHLLASIFQEAGYKTGLYTSPHLKNFTERIKINGQEVAEAKVATFVQKNYELLEQIQPSFFETAVALAFQYFAEEQVDIAIIEVGMGGRLDSTNIITPLLSVITNISYDHMEFLGDTLPKIAFEKAGIIKPKIPVLISEQQPETTDVFKQKAQEMNAPLFWAKDFYELKFMGYSPVGNLQLNALSIQPQNPHFELLETPLTGNYQLLNIRAVLSAIQIVQKYTSYSISKEAIEAGIKKCVQQTNFKGRWQILGQAPLTIADVAHNEGGLKIVLQQIQIIPHQELHIIFGTVNDKDADGVLSLLPTKAQYYFTQAQQPRALDAEQLTAKAQKFGLQGNTFNNVNIALQEARKKATTQDIILVVGSIFLIAEIDEL